MSLKYKELLILIASILDCLWFFFFPYLTELIKNDIIHFIINILCIVFGVIMMVFLTMKSK